MSGTKINLDSDLAVYNATAKAEHPKGIQLTWTHDGKTMSVVYAELRAHAVADWAERVRAFVQQTAQDKELRSRRDRDLEEAEKEAPVAQQAERRSDMPKAEGSSPSGRTSSQELTSKLIARNHPDSSPLEIMQVQLDDARKSLAAAEARADEENRAVDDAHKAVRMLEAAVSAMKAVEGESHEDGARKTGTDETAAQGQAGKHTRKKRSKKTRVQGSAQSTQAAES